MTTKVDSLVRELLALHIKYGRETFDHALDDLRSGKPLDALIETASKIAVASEIVRGFGRMKSESTAKKETRPEANSRKVARQLTKQGRISEAIRKLENSSVERDRAIAGFAASVRSKDFLASTSALRGYLRLLGESQIPARLDRTDATSVILKRLREAPDDQLSTLIEEAKKFDGAPSTLQGWSAMIVRSNGAE